MNPIKSLSRGWIRRAITLTVIAGAAIPAYQIYAQIPTDIPEKSRAPIAEPLAANPLILPVEKPDLVQDHVKTITTPRRVRDYRDGMDDATHKPKKAALPLYGYDFFQPARDIIDAHRAFLRNRYQGKNASPASKRAMSDATKTDGRAKSDARTKTSAQDSDTDTRTDENNPIDKPDRSTKDDTDTAFPKVVPDPDKADRDQAAEDSAATAGSASGSGLDTLTVDKTQRETGTDRTGAVRRVRPASPNTEDSAASETDPRQPEGPSDPGAINAYGNLADPLSQLYRDVTASVPAGYALAPGDTLTIRIWSARQEAKTAQYRVDGQGAILVPQVGPLVVRGQTLDQAEKNLRTQLRRYLNGAEVSLALDKLRTIQITVSGKAYLPGSYTVPFTATANNVLYAAGGPREDGALRNVQVRRQGKLVGSIDVYQLLIGGNQEDIPLQSGDILYIPPHQMRVTVSGEVLNPAIYELKKDETLRDALQYAGGVKSSGVEQHVQVTTLVPGDARVLKDINLKEAEVDHLALYDGDTVEIFSLRRELANRITIEGAVDQPGDYALTPGMHISELLQKARGPLGEAYTRRADLYRWNNDNTTTLIPVDLDKAQKGDPSSDLSLVKWDRLKVYSRQEIAWTGDRKVTIKGAVQRPGIYTLRDKMRISDLMLVAGGPVPDAHLERAVLLHQRGDGSFAYDYVNISDAIHETAGQDAALQDNDVLSVYKTGEAQFEAKHTVSIRGAVVAPGEYPRGDGMKLNDLLKNVGGLRPEAGGRIAIAHARRAMDATDATLNVVSVRLDDRRLCSAGDNISLEDGDVVTVQATGNFVDHVRVITVQGAVNTPGPIILSGAKTRLSDVIKQAGGLRAEAFPQGAEFTRDPAMMATTGQRGLTDIIGSLNDVMNINAYNRERGKSYVERIKAIGAASQGGSTSSLIPGLGGSSASATPNPGIGALTGQLSQTDLVSPARRLKPEEMAPSGIIAVNLPDALKHPGGTDDILLVDGDTITIPLTPTTVQVVGAVYSGRGVLYKPGAPIEYYIAQTGGFAPDAARDRIEVIHVGGGLIPAAKVRTLQPGDVIVVPTRVLAAKLEGHANGFDSFFRSLTSSAIVFKVASSLFGL